jgi:exonuclease III
MARSCKARRRLPSRAEGGGLGIPSVIEKAGYGAVWRGQKSWSGVAILAHDCEPVVTHTALPGDPADTQSRYIEAAVNGVLIGTLYGQQLSSDCAES